LGRRSALLVGTYDYSDTSLQRLAAPGRDVEALAEVLADPEIAGFDVTTLINKPHHVVGEAIGDFYDGLRTDDLALLYITGHGVKDDQGRLFLAMTDSRRNRLLFTAIGAEQINDAMNSCSSRQKVLILDCCYGGAFPSGWTAKGAADVHSLERFQGRGRVVLTASDAAQYSFEGDSLSGTGVSSLFTRYLVEGIRTGKADLDRDGDVSLDELYSYVHDRVIEEMPLQRPKKQEDIEGRIVIARNIAWTLPSHVQNAIESPLPLDRQAAIPSLFHLYRVGNETVRKQVREHIQKLIEDDSRTVSAAAADAITTMLPPEGRARPEPVAAPPEPDPVEQHSAPPVPELDPVEKHSELADEADEARVDKGATTSGVGRARHTARRRVLLAAASAVALVAAGGAIAALVLSYDGGAGSPSSAGANTYSTDSPWRLLLEDRIRLNDNGCTITLTDVNSGASTSLPAASLATSLYGHKSFQIHQSGSFRWQTNDPGCLVTPLAGPGATTLPFIVDQTGDSDAFVPPPRVAVQVKDYMGNQKCQFKLYDAVDGQTLDYATAIPGTDTVLLDSAGRQRVYVGYEYSCAYQVSAAS